jgi:hypothetical protein
MLPFSGRVIGGIFLLFSRKNEKVDFSKCGGFSSQTKIKVPKISEIMGILRFFICSSSKLSVFFR